jgi:hypothetical protein
VETEEKDEEAGSLAFFMCRGAGVEEGRLGAMAWG